MVSSDLSGGLHGPSQSGLDPRRIDQVAIQHSWIQAVQLIDQFGLFARGVFQTVAFVLGQVRKGQQAWRAPVEVLAGDRRRGDIVSIGAHE